MDEARFIDQLSAELDKIEASMSKIRKLVERRIATQPELFPTMAAPATAPRKRRAVQIPKDWQPSKQMLDDCGEKFPTVNAKEQIDGFRDYWIARGEPKADWDHCFRNWIRLAATRYSPRSGGVARPDKVASVSRSNSERAAEAVDRLRKLSQSSG